MGFLLTLVYLVLAYLTPAMLLPSLAQYRVQLIIVVIALLWSVPGFVSRRFLHAPEVYLLGAFLLAVSLSQVTNHWLGGSLFALSHFLPNAIIFYLILLNCGTLRRVKVVGTLLAIIAFGLVVQGARAYVSGLTSSSFLLAMNLDSGEQIIRIRGLSTLNDPNDLAQFLVTVIPFIWVMWRPGHTFRNLLLALVPTAFLIYGIFLTHSRGAIVALLVILLLALKDRLGITGSAVAVSLVFIAVLALGFTGGREMSSEAGSDRMAAWGEGLQFFKSAPIFGIGYSNFSDNYEITAHNSFVLCLAELGIVGYSIWMALLVFTFSTLNAVIAGTSSPELKRGVKSCLIPASVNGVFMTTEQDEQLRKKEYREELHRWAKMTRISLAGFLAAAWFLSRTYVMTLYLVLGLAMAICWVASEETEPVKLPTVSSLFAQTARFWLLPIGLVYFLLRVRSVL